MFSLASTRWRDWSGLDHNPVKGIVRYPEEGRERYLSPPELGALTKALAKHPNQQIANSIRLLVLIGARKMEVLAAKWDQFDLQEGVWVKPSAHTKQKREHRVPLNAPALQLLTEMRSATEGENTAESEFAFPGGQGNSHLTEIKKVWKTVCEEAGIAGCRVHDLRHTYASILASSGHSLPIIGQLLGHTQQATTKRYAHFYDDPLREATNRVGSLVDAAANGKTADVVDMAGRKG
jgi:integrase